VDAASREYEESVRDGQREDEAAASATHPQVLPRKG
jgi:hypothetical protein